MVNGAGGAAAPGGVPAADVSCRTGIGPLRAGTIIRAHHRTLIIIIYYRGGKGRSLSGDTDWTWARAAVTMAPLDGRASPDGQHHRT